MLSPQTGTTLYPKTAIARNRSGLYFSQPVSQVRALPMPYLHGRSLGLIDDVRQFCKTRPSRLPFRKTHTISSTLLAPPVPWL
jgi:hypothetical protein